MYLEVVIKKVQRSHANIQRELALRRTSGGRKHAQRYAMLRDGLHRIEFAHGPGEKVRAHFRGLLKDDSLGVSARDVGAGFLWHVGERSEICRHGHGDGEGSLNCRLVPAGKGTVVQHNNTIQTKQNKTRQKVHT